MIGVLTVGLRRRALVVVALALMVLAGWASGPTRGERVAVGATERAIHHLPHALAPTASVVVSRASHDVLRLQRRPMLRVLLWLGSMTAVVAAFERGATRRGAQLLGAKVQRVPLRRRGPPALV